MDKELLTRIAVALEAINSNLDSINNSLSETAVSLDSLEKNFDSLISVNRDSRFLCITGNVITN